MASPSFEDLDALVDRWFADFFSGGEIGRNTTIYNQVFASRNELKSRLAAAFAPSSPPPSAPRSKSVGAGADASSGDK